MESMTRGVHSARWRIAQAHSAICLPFTVRPFQRMSGIATATSELLACVAHTKTRILDTRKTVPGLRLLDKWAVRIGEGCCLGCVTVVLMALVLMVASDLSSVGAQFTWRIHRFCIAKRPSRGLCVFVLL
jgi:hypothetical protein